MDNINYDEKCIMNVFLNLMEQIGYGNIFVFGENNTRYSIYKEDNNWIIREKSDWGVEESHYTNIYNLCLDLIKKVHDNKKRDLCLRLFQNNIVIPKGTDVLIFHRIRGCNLDARDFIKGKIIGKRESDDMSFHESPWYDKTYIVQGEDNEYYIGKYGNAVEGYFFKTSEDYVSHIFSLIDKNNHQIKDLKKANLEYRKLLNNIIITHDDEWEKGK